MKINFKKIISLISVLCICLSFCSCSVFKTMRENALEASKKVILETPDEKKLLSAVSDYVDNSLTKAIEAKENVSYSIKDISVMSGEEKAGLLADSAKQIKNLIMASKPGSSSKDVSSEDKGLLAGLKNINMISNELKRNISSEKVTDEKGNPVSDDDNKERTTEYVSDNILHLTLNYFDTEVTETKTNDDGTTEEVTSVVGLDKATIEEVFGEAADHNDILAEFDSISSYVKVNSYDIEYTDCKIYSDILLDEEAVQFVKFEKNMLITAKVTGEGSLADYGEMTVSFKLTKTVNYSFTYAAE